MLLVFDYLRKNSKASEWEVQQFVLDKYVQLGLKTDKGPPIIAFRQNTAHVHYFPKKRCKKLENNSLILIDLWARLSEPGAPFADITWMAYRGAKVPAKIQQLFDSVVRIRDKAVSFIKSELKKDRIPTGKAVNDLTKQLVTDLGYHDKMNHYAGHCLGTSSPHGNKPHLKPSNAKPLLLNLAYTIEPGIYLPGLFGARSEINFYIDQRKNFVLTTRKQAKIVRI